jgi:hypothetical protein
MDTASTAIADLSKALEAARASGKLDRCTEVYVNFRLPRDEYEILAGTERVEDDPPGPPVRMKTVYEARGDAYDLYVTAGPEDD